ncbi:MAG: hypothetical protein EB101_05230 [Chitinophagia bacterium]|nr:hypothetical protein [Chitinophagia bacterium]
MAVVVQEDLPLQVMAAQVVAVLLIMGLLMELEQQDKVMTVDKPMVLEHQEQEQAEVETLL